MDRTSVDWTGPMPALTTPFHEDGGIDEKAFQLNVERLLGSGATGVLAGGCTGEFWALTHEERKRLYRLAKEAVGDAGTLIVGTGAVTVDEAVALTREAEETGLRWRPDPAALFRPADRRRDLCALFGRLGCSRDTDPAVQHSGKRGQRA